MDQGPKKPKASATSHPCLSCGACCASFRVSFYWREAEPSDHSPTVPAQAIGTDDFVSTVRTLKGTEDKHHPKCASLSGRIGDRVACTIYDSRPSPCRAFTASFENGLRNPRCDEARARHGLAPLAPRDFPQAPPDSKPPQLDRQL